MEVKSVPTTAHSPPAPTGIHLSASALDLQARARGFVEGVLIPLEQEAESLGGKLPAGTIAEVKRAAVAAGLDGGMHAREHGGQGWSRVEWALVEEQYGRTTNAIHWHVPQAYNVWAHASDEHIDRYLRPALRGELKDAYAVTARDAGSDPSGIVATARRTDAGFRLNGEKWFVTGGDRAAVFVVMANLVEGDVIGGIGGGEELQRSWFTEERLGIAARCGGAIWRLLDETVAWATARDQGGARVGDPKLVHHKASMAKLFTSEAAGRCADRCVQAFGGRGYLRSNVAERLLRELRVDRIWEGTSEIQRLIVARGLERRGVEAMLH